MENGQENRDVLLSRISNVNVYNNVVLIDKEFECEVINGENEFLVGSFPLRILDYEVKMSKKYNGHP